MSNNRLLIGSSKNVIDRWRNHKKKLRTGNHSSNALQKDWDTYGEYMFSFYMLENCIENLIDRENHFIELKRSTEEFYGYNKLKATKKEHILISNPVLTIKLSNAKVERFDNIVEAAKTTGVPAERIRRLVKYWIDNSISAGKSYYGYVFVKETDYNSDFDYVNYRRPYKPYNSTIRKAKEKLSPKPYSDRKINRKEIKLVSVGTGEELVFRSRQEAINQLGLKANKVYNCLKNPGINTHRGYFFYSIESVGED